MGARDFSAAAAELVAAVFAAHFRPPLAMHCADWADAHRQVVKGPEKGRWRTTRTPYLREPMNCTDPEDPVQKVVMQFATQLGKSEVGYNAVFKRVHIAPMDMMAVQPTLQDAKDHSRTRFAPTVRAMPWVAKNLPDPRSRDETNTWQTKEIAGGVAALFWAGANSARSLASKPLPFAWCDEIDGYPLDVDGEGDPLALVWERMSNFHDRKLLLMSTPTVKDFSRIEAEYLASDRRRYHVPCPHCLEHQVLVWGSDVEYGIKWLKTPAGEPRAETAVYICRHCGAAIAEHHKTDMLEQGRWIAENPGAQRGLVAGFHLSKLYSPVGWKSWSMLVDGWAAAQIAVRAGDSSRLKTFINTSLAETWEEQGDRASEHELWRRAEDFPLRVVRWGMFVMTMGVDVQGDRIEAYAWAWGRGMERQLVYREVLYGDPALPETEEGSPWSQLTELRRTPILHQSGRAVTLLCCMIDSAYQTHAVYSYCRAHRHAHVYPIKGVPGASKPIIGKPSDVDIDWRGHKIPRGAKLWPVGVDTGKAEIYGRLRTPTPGPGYIHLTKQLPRDVFEQLTAERLITKYVKGHPRLEWHKPNGKRNEALDCANYALAGAHWAGIDRWKEGDWSKWESRVQARDLFTEPAPGADPVVALAEPAPTIAPEPPRSPLGARISLAGIKRFNTDSAR